MPRNYRWGDWEDPSFDRDSVMPTFALYNWDPTAAPVKIAFVQPETFGGSGFPASKQDHAFVATSGPVYFQGVPQRGKRIVEFVVGDGDQADQLLSGPTTLVRYAGTGYATTAALAAGPDGLYFSDLYKDQDAASPTDPGARIFRVRVAPPANTSLPAVAGDPLPGQTLTADPGTWTQDPHFSYRWQLCAGGSYRQSVLQDGPLAYWRFEEATGTVAVDETGNDRDGTYAGPALGTAGAYSGSLAPSFDGVDDEVVVPGAVAPNPSGPMTVEAWARSLTPIWSADGFLVSKRSAYILNPDKGQLTLNFRVNADGTWRKTGTSSIPNWTPPAGFDITQWHHYVGVYDGSTVRLYLDGVEVVARQASGTIKADHGSLSIGRDDGLDSFGKAVIDEVAVYAKALSPARIAAHYARKAAEDGACSDIAGADGSTYIVKSTDTGSIRVAVTATGPTGATTAESPPRLLGVVEPPAAPTNVSAPTISGTLEVGETLTGTVGTWRGNPAPTFARQWQRCDPPAVAAAVLQDGPLAYWRLEEASGSVAADASGNGRNGTYQGPILGGPGAFAGSLAPSFDGVNDEVVVPGAAAPNPLGGVTVEAWARSLTPTWNADGFLVSKRNAYILNPDKGKKTLSFRVYAGGAWRKTGSASAPNWTPPPGFDITQWHHYVGVYDGSQVRLYVDGVQRVARAASGALKLDNGSLSIGRDDGLASFGKAVIDEVAVYSGALSSARIGAHFGAAQVGCSNIAGANAPTYTIVSGDAGKSLRLRVTATNPSGSATADSALTAAVSPG